jgi:type IV pilus assembly protein PilA
MLKSAQKATRGEGGFTLIELLVVMIIIAILMAVAVPTFLKQKQNAVATKAKANIKQIVTTIESCATANTTGSYTSPRTCLTPATLGSDEPVMLNILPGTAPETCGIAPLAPLGYTVTCSMQGDTGLVTFTESHATGGVLTKTCSPVGSKACPVAKW